MRRGATCEWVAKLQTRWWRYFWLVPDWTPRGRKRRKGEKKKEQNTQQMQRKKRRKEKKEKKQQQKGYKDKNWGRRERFDPASRNSRNLQESNRQSKEEKRRRENVTTAKRVFRCRFIKQPAMFSDKMAFCCTRMQIPRREAWLPYAT